MLAALPTLWLGEASLQWKGHVMCITPAFCGSKMTFMMGHTGIKT